ncbi:hypothetical protein NQ318_012862 [Aromia moschata]|uniref:Uncharacterized protein n=1 Tax=Aromia moschata TaxID=1265417 RepID=A0AAV8YF54_9CUCU|nr:hypothetical protein NQ318_012862 [Aromia moschata]
MAALELYYFTECPDISIPNPKPSALDEEYVWARSYANTNGSGWYAKSMPNQMPVQMSNPMGSPMVPQMANPHEWYDECPDES